MSEYVYATNGTPVSDTNGEISLPRERIIRCCDCEHYQRDQCCELFVLTDNRLLHIDEPNGFCAWGEKVRT